MIFILAASLAAPLTASGKDRPVQIPVAATHTHQKTAQEPDGPVNGFAKWSDTFSDSYGLSQLYHAAVGDSGVKLSQIQPLGSVPMGGEILAMTQGGDGRIYLATSGAYLNAYDPATGSMSFICAPVPTECFT
jgi:hypothetical protein